MCVHKANGWVPVASLLLEQMVQNIEPDIGIVWHGMA